MFSKIIWLLAGAWLLALAAPAQSVMLRGRVLDAETRQPIPNAQIGVADNRLGTVTSVDGYFSLLVPAAHQSGQLEVVMMGYQKHRQALPPLPGPELRIELRPRPTSLREVTVQGSVLGIVREAVARIPRNYPVRPTRLEGFFRESDNYLPQGAYRYLAEAVLTAYKAPYTRPKDDGDIVIRQSRKVALDSVRGFSSFGWYAGPFIPHRFDFVHNRLAFINEADFRDYDYRLSDLTTFRDQPVYVISFGPRTGNTRAEFEGQLYIAQDSYAFVAAEWHRTPVGIRNEHLNIDAELRAYRIDYQPYAERWHVKNVWYKTLARLSGGRRVQHLSEFLTTAVDTAQAAAPKYVERAQYRDVFLQNTVRYDSTFWQAATTLLPPAQLRQALREQERQRHAEQAFAPAADTGRAAPGARPARIGGPPPGRSITITLHSGAGLGVLPLQARPAELALTFAPAGSAFRAEARRRSPAPQWVPYYSFALRLGVGQSFSIDYLTRRAVGDFRGQGYGLGATYAYNLRPHHRPLRLRVGASHVRQRLRYALGTFDNPDAQLRLDGTRLDADRLQVAWQRAFRAWQPHLGFGLELTHRLELAADAGWLLPTRTRDELYVAEKRGFLLTRKQVELPLPTADATALVDEAPAPAPWKLGRPSLTLQLLYRPR
ncbi:carboxypeptidase-like regulatory domain-containing protein [Hymenobacter gummosus]|uniref:Carboxypeptidase-like regulatory domain-containing protein n=1 Tax=Hymenobacter gummosus TaxID=1776032 RepID=A0A431TW78_9BACT|nr:carboxypeptidase-like regulatory domain-containing protein [Hymenobacter gummosus]RTQ45799.1 carboxypeptidase-like regulatory domain-containing protein [Hymenobacter gummosus]